MKNLISGAYDLHVHTSPDITNRKFDDVEFCQRLVDKGMAGGIIKSHYLDTTTRAKLLKKQFPTLDIGGGIVLNRSVGGINPYAIEVSAKLGARIIWMPTMDSYDYQKFKLGNNEEKNLSNYVSICNKEGKLLSEIYNIFDIALANNIFIATGHIGCKEGMLLIKEASKLGVKTIITHADNPANYFDIDMQKEAVKLGALIEHCYFTVYHKKTKIEEIVEQIREVGCENTYLSTDFGQINSPYPDEGLLEFVDKLIEFNFTEKEIKTMICEIPKYIMNF